MIHDEMEARIASKNEERIHLAICKKAKINAVMSRLNILTLRTISWGLLRFPKELQNSLLGNSFPPRVPLKVFFALSCIVPDRGTVIERKAG